MMRSCDNTWGRVALGDLLTQWKFNRTGVVEHETCERASGIDEHGTAKRVSMHNMRNAMTNPAMLLCSKLTLARHVNTCARPETEHSVTCAMELF